MNNEFGQCIRFLFCQTSGVAECYVPVILCQPGNPAIYPDFDDCPRIIVLQLLPDKFYK